MAIPYDLTMVASMRRVEFGVSILVLFFFFQNVWGHSQKCILGVSLKNMNITREMRTHNIEYGLVSFTVRHSTSEK